MLLLTYKRPTRGRNPSDFSASARSWERSFVEDERRPQRAIITRDLSLLLTPSSRIVHQHDREHNVSYCTQTGSSLSTYLIPTYTWYSTVCAVYLMRTARRCCPNRQLVATSVSDGIRCGWTNIRLFCAVLCCAVRFDAVPRGASPRLTADCTARAVLRREILETYFP